MRWASAGSVASTWSGLFHTRFSLSGAEWILQGQSGGPAGLRRGPEGEFWCPRQLAGGDETGNGLPGQYGQHRVHCVRQQGQSCAAYLSETQWRLGDGLRESVHQAETNLVRGVWAMSASSGVMPRVFAGGSDEAACCRRGGGTSVGGVQGLPLLWNLCAERGGHQWNVSGVFVSVMISRCNQTHTHTLIHTYTRSALKVTFVFWFLSPSFHPSPTCARTEASVRWLKSARASPRSRPTPFAASATAKTPGICWAWSPAQHGESRVSGQVKKKWAVDIYVRCVCGLFSGRKWTKLTGSWRSCCTQTNAWPPAARTPSRLWWTLAPHCWRILNSTKPQAADHLHLDLDEHSLFIIIYLFINLFIQRKGLACHVACHSARCQLIALFPDRTCVYEPVLMRVWL